jgi:hypothetical protein
VARGWESPGARAAPPRPGFNWTRGARGVFFAFLGLLISRDFLNWTNVVIVFLQVHRFVCLHILYVLVPQPPNAHARLKNELLMKIW